jgi:hypothetical protein
MQGTTKIVVPPCDCCGCSQCEYEFTEYGKQPERFAPYRRTEVVVFNPPPSDKRTPEQAEDFIAHVRGTTGVAKLDDLGYKY